MERRAVPEARSAGGTVRRPARDGPLDRQGDELSEQGKYRSWTAQQKIEIVTLLREEAESPVAAEVG